LRSQNLPGLRAEKPTRPIVNNCYEKALASTENILTRRPAPGVLPLGFRAREDFHASPIILN
jgi:hypothetical protein